MQIIGLTGGICSGKTQVSQFFEALTVPVIDADIIARELLSGNCEDNPLLRQLYQLLQGHCFDTHYQLRRSCLRQLIFADKSIKQKLEQLLHPKVYENIDKRIQDFRDTNIPYLLISIPLLFETTHCLKFDRILLVSCPQEMQIQRCRQRDGSDERLIRQIIAQQMSDAEKRKRSDDIIENNKDLEYLHQQVLKYHDLYSKNSPK